MTTEERLDRMETDQRAARLLLVGVILCLVCGMILWALTREKPMRYTVTPSASGAYILDTMTGQLWRYGGEFQMGLEPKLHYVGRAEP
jgi:hypothetical protein